MPGMLLRNLDPRAGLCNGTRLLVQRVVDERLLEAKIATGEHTGDIVYIPRIMLYRLPRGAEERTFPWEWSRRQFPVRVTFAMVRGCPQTKHTPSQQRASHSHTVQASPRGTDDQQVAGPDARARGRLPLRRVLWPRAALRGRAAHLRFAVPPSVRRRV
mmetsp:Transcript_46674/g.151650  ORF Transcript_46674/g.151650 Transcript_46674/m.151650 type:complete len:159 (-) Transcript_46674:29-505(-)